MNLKLAEAVTSQRLRQKEGEMQQGLAAKDVQGNIQSTGCFIYQELIMNKTPDSHITRALRLLWLHSRERAEALKRDNYSCCKCGVKQSRAKGKEQKVEVHHKKGILNWESIYAVIREQLLCDIEHLETLCPNCHKEE